MNSTTGDNNNETYIQEQSDKVPGTYLSIGEMACLDNLLYNSCLDRIFLQQRQRDLLVNVPGYKHQPKNLTSFLMDDKK